MSERVPAASVIVATRNRAPLLASCLSDLALQRTSADLEVVVVDNASTDDTRALVEKLAGSDPRLSYVFEERVGLSAAKNAGVRAARAELLLFTDDDVVLGSTWARAYIAFFSAHPDALVAGGPVLPVPDDLGPWPPWLGSEARADLPLLDHRGERPLRGFEYIWGANLAARASIFDRLGPWDTSVGRQGEERGSYEDVELAERVRSAGETVWFCPGAPLRHRIDASWIAPRRILERAFNRGTVDHWRRIHGVGTAGMGGVGKAGGGKTGVELAAWPSVERGTLSFGASGARWLWWGALLRLSCSQPVFARAHRAAWRSGWTMQALAMAAPGARSDRAARRAGRLLRSLARRLAPAEGKEHRIHPSSRP